MVIITKKSAKKKEYQFHNFIFSLSKISKYFNDFLIFTGDYLEYGLLSSGCIDQYSKKLNTKITTSIINTRRTKSDKFSTI